MEQTKITVVTVCYNAEDCIEKTILSVINQNYDNVEYIIIDGNSADSTMTIVNKYIERITLCISEKDNGIYDAMNKAIDLASGEWINFMNAGDTFYNQDVLSVVNGLVDNGDTAVVFGDTELVEGSYTKISKGVLYDKKFPDLGHQSTFVKTVWMKKYHFDLSYKIGADFDFLYKLFINGYKFQYLNRIVARYDISGLSSSNRSLLYKEHCQIRGRKPEILKNIKYSLEDKTPMDIIHILSRAKSLCLKSYNKLAEWKKK